MPRKSVRSRGARKPTRSASKRRRKVGGATASRRAAQPTPELETQVDRVGPQLTLERGPAKERRRGRAPVRLTTHKTRGKWFQSRAAWPVREAPIGRVVSERLRMHRSAAPAPGAAQWECVGPTNIGGRLTSIVCDPARPERIWVGAAGGGVWHSADAGRTWLAQWHDQDVLNVGSLALDPRNPDVLYCGTGEANLSADSYAGVGIYQSRDSGATWRLLAAADEGRLPRRIGTIAIDPFDPRHLFIGGIGFDEVGRGDDVGGLYTSADGGVTWRRETFVTAHNYWCHQVLFHPAERGTAYAAITERGARNGIYRTQDGGATWEQLKRGWPDTARIGRASLAFCASRPSVIYAYAADVLSGRADRVLGVFRSANGGESWREVGGAHFADEGQSSYNNTIAVHPRDADHVICGGVDLHVSHDGGRTWKRTSRWNAPRGAANYAHADHHALLMPASAPGRIYDANDGGLDVSEDGGESWVNRSSGLAVTMYYDMDVAATDGRVFGGGSQDNGTLVTTSGRSDDHYELLGGDGGWIVWDPTDASRVFASYYNLNIFRFEGLHWKDVSPTEDEAEKGSVWMAYIAIDATNPRRLFTASNRVWRTDNHGESWRPVSPVLDGSVVTAIEIAGANGKRVYVGTENGGIFRSDDGGVSWSPNLASATLPGHSVTRLKTRPGNADIVFATVANFRHPHVFRSRDGARTWEDVDRGQLPDVPHNSIAIARTAPDTIYVCNDVGVFASFDDALTWFDLSRNLPNAMVVDLVHHERDQTLSAATYGRSIWRLALR
jgi:photosystem II stability/assembly factor-like uncharacterized protein